MHGLFVLSAALALAAAIFMLAAGTRPYKKKSRCLMATLINSLTSISLGTHSLVLYGKNAFDPLTAAFCLATLGWLVLTIDHFREFTKNNLSKKA